MNPASLKSLGKQKQILLPSDIISIDTRYSNPIRFQIPIFYKRNLLRCRFLNFDYFNKKANFDHITIDEGSSVPQPMFQIQLHFQNFRNSMIHSDLDLVDFSIIFFDVKICLENF